MREQTASLWLALLIWSEKYNSNMLWESWVNNKGLLTLKHNTVLIMLFGLSVAPLHSDLCCMLHANTAAALCFTLSVLFFNCIHESHICVWCCLFIHPVCPATWPDDSALRMFVRVCVLGAWLIYYCCQCCVVWWLCSRSKAWSTPARDYKELPTCTHTTLHACMLIGEEEAWEQFCEQEPLLLKYCLAS